MKFGRLIRRIAVAVAMGVVLPLVAAAPANAVVDPSAPVWYETSVTGVTRTSNVIRYDMRLGRCGGSPSPTSCTITSGKIATRTIGVTFGISVGAVAATLGISSARSVTITAGCTGSTRPPTYPWVSGYAFGDTYRYTIQQRTYQYGRLTQTANSVQYAFNPTGIRCAYSSS
ncbi:hypothetical protein [Blastococcus sp. CT_GayMR16]|uniref:hypothetical protein n=1 Tax=Blastococcus sp. CT_GayMR16 TaxID=2559607 RepID=UPI0010734102|nr:hypothetical protein [Blastococcus sp. CT_GayMR16]TFV86151.1 hypothetical protein E4P38_18015 [Blastococcus sp. CT_GayMR16]